MASAPRPLGSSTTTQEPALTSRIACRSRSDSKPLAGTTRCVSKCRTSVAEANSSCLVMYGSRHGTPSCAILKLIETAVRSASVRSKTRTPVLTSFNLHERSASSSFSTGSESMTMLLPVHARVTSCRISNSGLKPKKERSWSRNEVFSEKMASYLPVIFAGEWSAASTWSAHGAPVAGADTGAAAAASPPVPLPSAASAPASPASLLASANG
mmetsp:Transcript_363/g.688  ORF Transcript_363/g.688 Transcript_363/m.688 type:complete len:213 (-) Transcript_363:85-723(-)